MVVKKSAKAEKENAAIKLKAAEKAHLQPGSNLKTGRSSNQSGAAAMNAAVKRDVEKQAQENEQTATKLEEAQEDFDEKSEIVVQEEDAEKAKKLAAVEQEKEIERRAEARFQKKMAAVPKTVTAPMPSVVDPHDHTYCCHRATQTIDYIGKLLTGLPVEKPAMSVWLKMLDSLAVKTQARSKGPAVFKVPKKMTYFGSIKGDFGSDRKNDIFMNEFRGHCENLITVLEDFSGDWQHPLIFYTRALIKAIE